MSEMGRIPLTKSRVDTTKSMSISLIDFASMSPSSAVSSSILSGCTIGIEQLMKGQPVVPSNKVSSIGTGMTKPSGR